MIKVIDKNGNQKIYSTGTGGGGGGGGVWGAITGTISAQLDLQAEFATKQDAVTRQHEFVPGAPANDYNAHAPVGSLTSAASWTIYKLVINLDGSSVLYHADDNPSAIWDNRTTITYSV